jgi:hypothetical protein
MDPKDPGARESSIDEGAPPDAAADCAGFFTERDARNRRRLDARMILAALAYVGAAAALRWRASIPAAVVALAVVVAVLLAAVAVRAYRDFLRAADELLRKTQMEALALGFAAGVVFSLVWPLLELVGAPHLGTDAAAVVLLLTAGVGWWIGVRRYTRGGAA